MVLIYKSLDVCDMIVVYHKYWILECVQLVQLVQDIRYFKMLTDMRIITNPETAFYVQLSVSTQFRARSISFEDGTSLELEFRNG